MYLSYVTKLITTKVSTDDVIPIIEDIKGGLIYRDDIPKRIVRAAASVVLMQQVDSMVEIENIIRYGLKISRSNGGYLITISDVNNITTYRKFIE